MIETSPTFNLLQYVGQMSVELNDYAASLHRRDVVTYTRATVKTVPRTFVTGGLSASAGHFNLPCVSNATSTLLGSVSPGMMATVSPSLGAASGLPAGKSVKGELKDAMEPQWFM